MAPGAKLIIQDAGYAPDDCGDLPGIGCPVTDLHPDLPAGLRPGRARAQQLVERQRERRGPEHLHRRLAGRRRVHVGQPRFPDRLRRGKPGLAGGDLREDR